MVLHDELTKLDYSIQNLLIKWIRKYKCIMEDADYSLR